MVAGLTMCAFVPAAQRCCAIWEIRRGMTAPAKARRALQLTIARRDRGRWSLGRRRFSSEGVGLFPDLDITDAVGSIETNVSHDSDVEWEPIRRQQYFEVR